MVEFPSARSNPCVTMPIHAAFEVQVFAASAASDELEIPRWIATDRPDRGSLFVGKNRYGRRA
jgi:hypothetical protein